MKKYKHNRKLITVICDECNKEYEKPISEYNRNKNNNRHSFCSRSCSASYTNKHRKVNTVSNITNKRIANPFLYYMKLIKNRFKEINITIKDLELQWNNQNGICPYSGIELKLATHTNTNINPIYRASIDRIDSSKGYVINNIQFVSTSINYMKNKLTHNETIDLCKLISKNYS